MFGLFHAWKRLPQLKAVQRPVFVVGTGRSGTTILGIVLSMHRQVGFLNEPKALWHAVHDGEDLVGSYSQEAARYRLGIADATPAVTRSAHRLAGAYLAASFSGRLVDKYPELIFRVPFVQAMFPDARFVLVVRNGWETVQSIVEWQRSLAAYESVQDADWWGAERRKWRLLVEQIVPEHADLAPHAGDMKDWTSQSAMAAVEWIVSMREGLAVERHHTESVLRVDYGRLCASPESVIAQIAEFAGLASGDHAFVQYAARTLKPAKSCAPCELPASLCEPFADVMRQLGYGH